MDPTVCPTTTTTTTTITTTTTLHTYRIPHSLSCRLATTNFTTLHKFRTLHSLSCSYYYYCYCRTTLQLHYISLEFLTDCPVATTVTTTTTTVTTTLHKFTIHHSLSCRLLLLLLLRLNETWLDTQSKLLLAEVSIYGYKVFHVDNSNRKGRWINHVSQKHLEPNRKKVISYLPKGNYSR